MPYYEQSEFDYEMQRQERQAEDAYWEWIWQDEYEEDMKRSQEMAEFPLFYWRETCCPILNIKTGKTT